MFYWVLLFVGIVLTVGLNETYEDHCYKWQWVKIKLPKRFGLLYWGDVAVIIAFFFTVAVFLSPFFLEYVGKDKVFSVDKDGIIQSSSDFAVIDLPWGDERVVSLSLEDYEVKILVQPVTVNPKVRHMVSRLWFKIADPQLYINSLTENERRAQWGESAITRKAESALYEFHEKYSVELGKFYNPHDRVQQDEFSKLVLGAVSPILARQGIEVTGASFSM